MSIALGFGDGSVGTINYFANGSARYPKETLEVFSEGRVLPACVCAALSAWNGAKKRMSAKIALQRGMRKMKIS